ncbi:hypothetical protein F3Y22_tig00110925pilonHSYRG00035 [Hibiscus syriacus]|uniref:Integrase catalytic domain-containing protein n=1 Tax=Hibiscus syriacus TaxID=106335 RepID=A0A6A2ZE62_HIBSY|nr:hypothetical protein F3Y22_tig00110925pilonHSYRG00035 [Hibiscus syriacus]
MHVKGLLLLVVGSYWKCTWRASVVVVVKSLSKVVGISETLLIVSHDGYFEEMNKIVEGIKFCQVKQIFAPYSPHVFSGSFHGVSPNDCKEKDYAGERHCIGDPDQYGNHRSPKIVSLKHHWWWMMNIVWDRLKETRGRDGYILFIEDDHFIFPNTYRNLQLPVSLKPDKCPDCYAANLAPCDGQGNNNAYIDNGSVNIQVEDIDKVANIIIRMGCRSYLFITVHVNSKFRRRYEFVDGGVLIHSGSQELSETIQTNPDSSGSDGCRRREGKQPQGMKNEDWALLDRQALRVIRLTLSRNVAFNIAKEKTTAGLMAALSSMYEKPSALNKVHLMSWNATVTAVSSSSGNSKLKFDDVRDLGHFKRDCRALKKDTGAQESANMTEETSDAMILIVNSPIESWILDSGASFHSTPYLEIMENYVSGDFGKVHLADDETLKIVGKGDIRLKLPNQTTWKLTGVRYILGLKRNLISIGQLDGEGYSTTFSGCEWKITKGALVIARGKKTDTLYVTSNLENIIATIDADGKSNLWHQRLGHMSEKGMKTLLSKGKLSDLKNVDVRLCEDYIFGKQKKVSFAKNDSLYYITFIDDSTRNVWVYFLKKKSEVFDIFRKWKAMVENETGLKVKRLRSDNGGEYKNRRFRYFCANNGIKMETTVPMTPQHNGVAERMNRTLNERARSMRIHAGLPKFLWAEAINTAAYLINRGPSIPLDGRIPEEVWSKKEINLSHLRVFGCISYVHISSAERSKLDAKSNKCVFVGYGGDEFGYRFWDYENRKIIRSRDVIFNENVMYKDRSTVESSSSNTKVETKEFVEFEEISGNDVQISPEAAQEKPGTPELRRSSRISKPTQRYSPSLHYLLLTDNGEPECYDEAMQVEDSIKWESSMKDEMIKEEHDGSKHYKARLIVKAAENLHLEQLDVKTAFLHGDLKEEIYMRQPEGFIEVGKKNLVCRLKKSLYGLKQAPRQWYKKFDIFMSSNGFTRCQADHCCYIKRFDNSFIILLLYVDDMLVADSDMQEIIHLKQELSKQFAMKDMGVAKQILGMRIKRDTKSGTLMLSQAEYINKVLSRFNMQDAKPVSTPLGVHFRLSKEQSPKTEEECANMVKVSYASAIGSMMYAMVCTRPDIAYAVGVVSRYMNNPGKVHWEAVKWILRYLRGTTNKALCFKGGDTILTRYVDADLAGNVDIRRSTTGYVYTLGGTAVSWVSQLQKIVALSTTEAEYVSVTKASKEMVWLQSFLEELGKKQENNVLYCDSQSAIHLAKNPSFHSRTKHIQLRYHFIRLEDVILKLEKISRAQNPADMLTKTVTTDKLKLCSASVGMLE